MLDLKRLRELVPLNTLPEALLERLAPQLPLESLPKGAVLFEEGVVDHDAIYLIEGALELVTRGSTLARVLQGGTPEAAHPLAPGTPRPCTARALSPVKILRLDRRKLDRLVVFEQLTTLVTTVEPGGPVRMSVDASLVAALAASSAFGHLPRRQIQRLLERMRPIPVRSGQVVLRQGQPCEDYYIVREGRFVVSRKDEQGKVHLLGELGRGASFGAAETLVAGAPCPHTVVALAPGLLLGLARKYFEALLDSPVDT